MCVPSQRPQPGGGMGSNWASYFASDPAIGRSNGGGELISLICWLLPFYFSTEGWPVTRIQGTREVERLDSEGILHKPVSLTFSQKICEEGASIALKPQKRPGHDVGRAAGGKFPRGCHTLIVLFTKMSAYGV